MTPPDWALSLAYWLHMLATVIWIGGLASLAIFVVPVAHATLPAGDYPRFLSKIQRRLDPLGWLCLLLLAGTGMFQMNANPNYVGLLAIDSRWALAILVKHLLFLGMAGVSAGLTWGVIPRLNRIAMRRAANQDAPEAAQVQRLETALLRLNLALGVLALALTAIARTS
ncbi:MAG: CopD family protein [Anaerolineales bacterium]|nr:CopD family protein [Anaerolineales bacterium]